MISINRSIYYEKGAKDKLGNILGSSTYIDTWFTDYHHDDNDSPSKKKSVKVKKIISLNSSKKVSPTNSWLFIIIIKLISKASGKSRSEWSTIEYRIFIHLYSRLSSRSTYEKEKSCLCFGN